MARQPVQTPGEDPTAATSNTETADISADQQQMADLAAASSADSASDVAAENAELRAEMATMRQQMADLARIVRKTAESGQAAAVQKLPTVAEVQKQDPKQPVLTDAGWYVPASENWAVSAGNSKRLA